MTDQTDHADRTEHAGQTDRAGSDADAARPVARPEGARRIKGLFSSNVVEKVGTGTTQRKTISKTYWYCTQAADDAVTIQPLNRNMVPSGPTKDVPLDVFLEGYSPEPELYVKTVYPKMRELAGTVARAEENRQRGALYSAQFDYEHALAVDEDNVRANFGLGLTYVERGETAKAKDILGRIVGLDAAFAPEHKHLFNEFGISLRKSHLVEQALQYYGRALTLSQNDENLHYNIARAYYEHGEEDKCREHLATALRLNPKHAEAKKFLDFLDGQKKPGAAS